MILNYESRDYIIISPKYKSWGLRQIQSVINNKVTINFENAGKMVINSSEITLEKINRFE